MHRKQKRYNPYNTGNVQKSDSRVVRVLFISEKLVLKVETF